MNNTSHLWSNWGHSPESLRDEYGDSVKTAFSNEFLEELKTKNGEKVMNRIMKEIKANINVLSQMPEQSMNMFFDQWLASVYHANANREGSFGDRAWNFYTFDIAEKLRENLFTCLLPDGSPIVVASPSLNKLFDEDNISCLTVLVDMGGWFIAYGSQMGWKGLRARDKEATFDFPPEWARKKRNAWFHEISEKSSGKIERWIFNKDDYLASSAVYHDIKTGTVLLYSCDEELFDKALEEFSPFFDQKHCDVIKMSMSLAPLIKNNKKGKLLERFEKGF